MLRLVKAKRTDAKKISKLMINNINLLSSREYSKEQILEMKRYASERNVEKYITHFEVYVVMDRGIVGTISNEKEMIFSFYTKDSKNFINSKSGATILKLIESKLKERYKEIFVISMPTTKVFFEKNGYKIVKPLKLNSNGIIFREFKLRKKL